MSDSTIEKRKYLRFKDRLSVDFNVVDLQQGLLPGVGWQKGSTLNVSKGGICLETEYLKESTIRYLNQQSFLLELKIYVPLMQKPIKAVGQVMWHEKIDSPSGVRYILGLKFRSIKAEDLVMLIRQTTRFKYLMVTIGILTAVFVASLLYHFVIHKS